MEFSLRVPLHALPGALAVLLACPVSAAVIDLKPREAVQGGFVVVRVHTSARAGTVLALGRSVPLFPARGGLRGIIPVSLRAKPGRRVVEASAGGKNSRAVLTVAARNVGPVRRLTSLNVTGTDAAALQASRGGIRAALRTVTAEAFWSAHLRRPVPGRITAIFGTPRAYGGGASWPHRGVDYSAPSGWPVIACAAGRVVMAARLRVYGNIIIVDHGQTVFTAYMHLKRRRVKAGERVEQGQVIGLAGATGLAKGSHLHLGAYVAGVAVDPLELLRRGLPTEGFRFRPPGKEGLR